MNYRPKISLIPLNTALKTAQFAALLLLLCAAPLLADDASNRLTNAENAYRNGQFSQAQILYSEFLSVYPSHAKSDEALFYLAESYLNLEQYDAAISCYNRLVTLDLNSNSYARAALFRLGDVPYIRGQYDIAKPNLERFVRQLPHDNNLQFVLYYLGDIAMRANEPAEAEHYFGQCGTLFPNGAKITESKIGLAWAKNQLGNTMAADEIFRASLAQNNPAVSEPATYQWGVAQYERGDYNAATATLTAFLSRYPQNSQYYTDVQRVLARCKAAQNDFQGTLNILTQIANPNTDDVLLKIRCLYGLKQTQEAQNLLSGIEQTAGAAYRDEIALLKSFFLYDQRNYQEAVSTLSQILLPVFNEQTGKMTFNYTSLPVYAGGQRMSDDSFLKACSLLATAYAQLGDSARSNAVLTEMQGQAALSGRADLMKIVSDTSGQLSNIYAQNANQPFNNGNNNSGGRRNNNQWSNNNNTNNNGTETQRFSQAVQMYTQRNWNGAVQILEPLLGVQYNPWTKQCTINYMVNQQNGALNETTLIQACSVLALAQAQLGNLDYGTAMFAAFSQRANPAVSAQTDVVRQTQTMLAQLTGGNFNSINNTAYAGAYSETEQRQILRTCQSLYNARRYEQVDAKLLDLIGKTASETIKTEAMLLRSKALFELGKEQEALQTLDSIVRNHPNSPSCADALWYSGYYYEFNGDSYRALEYLQMLADQYPNHRKIDGALYFLALEDMKNGSGRKASGYLARIYRNHQNGDYWSHAVWILAVEAYKKRDNEQAELLLSQILQHPPDAAILDRVLFLRGELALQKEDFAIAAVAFQGVSRLCPDSSLRREADKNAQTAAAKAAAVR
ncbi:MAG: tetratricopeptide repeat protein [Planctomycetaceae bacterium]|nr:tetratricopeptide repeat protein [Planctomycetaceae bacterium]